MRHVVMFSGGIGSWAAAMRVKEDMPDDPITLLFADVGGRHESPHDGEDEDCYRFIHEAAEQLESELIVLNQGMNIWEIFKKDRFLGNARLANCSKFLKQRPCRKWLQENTDPDEAAVFVGIDWTETHRISAIRQAYDPWPAFAPLAERKPYLSKDDMMDWARSVGLKPPQMYEHGYPHANCGGGCVRAGHAQFKLLLEQNPERFAWWERNEQDLRDYLDKPVAILRDRSGGRTRPMPLSEFREKLQGGPEQMSLLDLDEYGGCGCFVD
jgi:3'-phosphoadenosine 5'-phosphosulfate sulfotransferase (PAPS reductase)/FAD synthetase